LIPPRTLCCVRQVIPSTSRNFNMCIFNSEAVKDQFLTLDCLTFEVEGSMILLKSRKILAQLQCHFPKELDCWHCCTLSKPVSTSCQLISIIHSVRFSRTNHCHYMRRAICRCFRLLLTDLVLMMFLCYQLYM
jgi:hypothetical protein